MKKAKILFFILCIVLIGIINANAKENTSVLIDQMALESLNNTFLKEGENYKDTIKILDSTKLSETLRNEYDSKLDTFMNDGYYTLFKYNANTNAIKTGINDDLREIIARPMIVNCEESINEYTCDVFYTYSINEEADSLDSCIEQANQENRASCSSNPNGKFYVQYNMETTHYQIVIEKEMHDPSEEVFEKINAYYDDFGSNKSVHLNDLDIINLVLSINLDQTNFASYDNLASFVDEVNSYFPEGNITLAHRTSRGMSNEIEFWSSGILKVAYNDVIYDISFRGADPGNISIGFDGVFFVPAGTDREDYATTVENRIKSYINNNSYTISVENTNEVFENADSDYIEQYDTTLYNLTIGLEDTTFTRKILIDEGTTEDLKLPEVNYQDFNSKLIFKTTSSDIPIDATFNIEQITENNDFYEVIKDKLETEDFVAYDISLFSLLRGSITRINNGLIYVYIPVPDNYVEENAKVYYISDDGTTVTEHAIVGYITEDNIKYAYFTTNHFSTYALANGGNILNPPTNDSLFNWTILGGISLLAMLGTGIYLKKKQGIN